MYADDLVILASNRDALQHCLDSLASWCAENKMTVNTNKTKIMKFRKGGPLSKNDKIQPFTINNQPLEIVTSFEYLGVTLQPTLAVTIHMDKVAAKCARATHAIPNIHLLSVDAAIQLFNIMIRPIALYVLQSLWEEMTLTNFRQLDRIKSSFLKSALRVSKFYSNTKVHLLTNSEHLSAEARRMFDLPETPAYLLRKEEANNKKDSVELAFYNCPAMLQDSWKQTNNIRRHIVTRQAMHGFHHAICDARCAEPTERCRCRLCGEHADRYHLMTCSANSTPLSHWAGTG